MSIIKIYLSHLASISRKQKIVLLIGLLTGLFAFLSFYSSDFSLYIAKAFDLEVYVDGEFRYQPISETYIPLIPALISVAAFAFYYLQFEGAQTNAPNDKWKKEYSELRLTLEKTTKDVQNIRSMIDNLEGVDKESRESLLKAVVDEIEKEAVDHHIDAKISLIKENLKHEAKIGYFEESFSLSRSRLQKEIMKLGLRSNINLIIGMIITISGLFLLWDTVGILNNEEVIGGADGKNQSFYRAISLHFVPRITLVVFIELFAYFFLRLYKESLSEMKYFQNELTNIESKHVALVAAFESDNKVGLENILNQLIETERNHILNKGQTTVELEKAKSDTDLVKSFSHAIPSMLKGMKINK